MTYDLWYWPGLPGRGEFVRLALVAAGLDYNECAQGDGERLAKDMKARDPQPFAPPYLIAPDGTLVWQVANILSFLTARHDLAPEGDRPWLDGLQETISDMVAETHNVHHPVGVSAYYDDQKAEAKRFAAQFRDERMPKFFGFFEHALGRRDGDWIAGERCSPVDTSLFQLVGGLRYAFPKRMAALEPDYPRLVALHDAVAALPPITAYLASDRRTAFNENGIFRHYPELDGDE